MEKRPFKSMLDKMLEVPARITSYIEEAEKESIKRHINLALDIIQLVHKRFDITPDTLKTIAVLASNADQVYVDRTCSEWTYPHSGLQPPSIYSMLKKAQCGEGDEELLKLIANTHRNPELADQKAIYRAVTIGNSLLNEMHSRIPKPPMLLFRGTRENIAEYAMRPENTQEQPSLQDYNEFCAAKARKGRAKT